MDPQYNLWITGSSPVFNTKVELILVNIGTMLKIENFCMADRSGKRQWRGGNLVRFKIKPCEGIEPSNLFQLKYAGVAQLVAQLTCNQ